MRYDADTVPRAALVTGAARRIGGALAADLAAHGWAVAVHYNTSEQDALDLVARIEAAGGTGVALRADLTREAQTESLIPSAVERLGPLGCLINNASVFENDTVKTATRESWDRHLEVNLRAPLVLSQAFAAQLPERRCGCIINIVDQRVWNLTPYFLSYTVGKSGLWTLTRTLAMALAPRIRVNALGPGPTLPSARQSKGLFERQVSRLPLGRGPTPGEICEAVRFVLDASSMTGQMLALDGGQHQGWAQPGSDDAMVE